MCVYRLRSRNSVLEMVVTHFKLSIPGPSPLLTLSTPTAINDTQTSTMLANSSLVAATNDSLCCEIIPQVTTIAAVGNDVSTSDPSAPSFSTATPSASTASPASAASSAPSIATDNRKYTQIAAFAQGPDITSINNNNIKPIQSLYTAPNTYSPLPSRRTHPPTTTSPTTSTITSTGLGTDAESFSSYSSSNTDRPILLFKSTQERERDIITDTTYILDTSDAFNPYRKRAPVPGSVVSHTRVSTSTGMLLFSILIILYLL